MNARFASVWVLVALGAAATACGSGADDSSAASGGSGGSAAGAAGAGNGGTAGVGGSVGGVGGAGGATGGAAGSSGSAGTGGVTACSPDADGDNILDEFEGRDTNRDSDGDGTPDYLDTDSDDDGIPDLFEGDPLGCDAPDSDGDGKPNFIDLDSDDNGIPDADEFYADGSAYDPNKPPGDVDGDGLPDAYDDDNDGDYVKDVDELGGKPPVDTDLDGAYDHNDPDSDDDGIRDDFEGTDDTDGDGKPDFRDLDSDGDLVPDACEAGFGHQLDQDAVNTDADANADPYDRDSDNDGLVDSVEDKNGDCTVNQGETDRIKADTDGDGANDLIEDTLGSDPTRSAETPQSLGRYYFVMPYQESPIPKQQDVVLKTNLNKGDIAFVVDATGSMGPAINNIRSNLNSLITTIKADVPEAQFGVAAAQDFPVEPYGASTNLPVSVTPNGYMTSDITKTQAAVDALTTDNGNDPPEALIPALHKVIANGATFWPGGGYQAPFTPGTGSYGALGFRADALPILVLISDAASHNGRRVVCAESPFQACREGCCSTTESTLHDQYSFSAPTADDLVTELQDHGAKVIGVALNDGGTQRYAGPYPDMAFLVDQTGSHVRPSSFSGSQCATDVYSNTVAPDGPTVNGFNTCRLIFASHKDGSTVANTIAAGVKALLSGLQVSVRLRARNDTNPPYLAINTIADFVDSIEVYPQGNIQDPAEPGTFCEFLPSVNLEDNWADNFGTVAGTDGKFDTVKDLVPGTRICFRIKAKSNTSVAQTSQVQVASARLQVQAKNTGQTDELLVGQPRDVLFVIPPVPQ
ncbi:MAG: hypothetical protein KC766_32975 [Myxococcales bacterium]|nr:hypothetical protein [Myxococcales bacterium]